MITSPFPSAGPIRKMVRIKPTPYTGTFWCFSGSLTVLGHAKNNSQEDMKEALNYPPAYFFILQHYKSPSISLSPSLGVLLDMSDMKFVSAS